MLETGITPDFVSVDGGEGGTGAAPLEFSNSMGMPARDAWIFVHSALRGVDLRDRIKIIASGKILTGFHMVRALALGRGRVRIGARHDAGAGLHPVVALQHQQCPTGVTTQNPALV